VSLVSFALRLIVTRVIKGRTWAGDSVLNAPIEPIAHVLSRADPNPRPVVGVFTQETTSKPAGIDYGTRGQRVELILFIYLPPTMRPLADQTIEIDQSASAMSLDCVSRQISNELRAGTSLWREMWAKFAVSVAEHDAKAVLIEIDQGVRVACLEVRLLVDALPEPDVGKPIGGHWLALDTMMRADPETAGIADAIKSLIEFRTMPAWEAAQAQFALSDAAARTMGYTPQDITETGEPAVLTEIDFSEGTTP